MSGSRVGVCLQGLNSRHTFDGKRKSHFRSVKGGTKAMKRATLILGLAVLLCGATGAQATPIKITYTITATATGTLGTQPFTDALVTIEFVGDPSKAHLGAPAAHLWVNSGTGTVTIAGVGTATFTPGPVAFDDQGGVP